MAKVGSASTVQFVYRKWGTHVRVFSRTLVDGNSEIEIREESRVRMKADGVKMEISETGTKEK